LKTKQCFFLSHIAFRLLLFYCVDTLLDHI